MTSETIVIPRRFNGPPDSGHGGYSCGVVGVLVGDPAEVTLRMPPPLDRELTVERSDGSVALMDGESVVAEGRGAALDLQPPESPGIDAAEAANRRGLELFREHGHPFPTCLVCGPDRGVDGFGVFVAPLGGGDGAYAASWTPAPALAGSDGTVPAELVWAALDCPSAGPAMNWGGDPPCVLARLAVALDKPVVAGEQHAFLSWPLRLDGRKRETGVAIYNDSDDVLARGRALWIELKR